MLATLPQIGPLQSASTFLQWFDIGGVCLQVRGNSSSDVYVGPELQPFRRQPLPHGTEIDLDLEVTWVDEIISRDKETNFESGATWRLFNHHAEFEFEFTSPVFRYGPYKRLRVEHGFRLAEIILSRAAREHCGRIAPFEYPANELLITNYLASCGLGVEVHGCGVIDRETGGHLFLGHSGAGKSTTAKLWESLREPEILSDDRIILRLHDGELWMYGTPWHGEAAFASPARAKLKRIHILRHGRENKFTPVARSRAVGEIFARSFPPFHSPSGVGRTLDFINRALEIAPCYEFEFLPDGSSIAAVLESCSS